MACQVSASPPYSSLSRESAAQLSAERGNQKKNFSGRSRASTASANSCEMSASVRTTSTRMLKPHDVHSGVYEEDVAGDAAAKVAGEEDGGVSHFGRVGIAVQGRAVFDDVQNGGKILDRARGGGLDGAGGNGVDADLLRAEIAGEVA